MMNGSDFWDSTAMLLKAPITGPFSPASLRAAATTTPFAAMFLSHAQTEAATHGRRIQMRSHAMTAPPSTRTVDPVA